MPRPTQMLIIFQTDQFGTKLLDLCKACDLRIANGRLLGDHLGSYTCFNYNSTPSVIDYLLVDANLIDSVEIFHVHPLLPTSIHCCISTVLKYRPDIHPNDSSENNDQTLRTTGTRYIWSPVHELSFKQALSSQGNTSSLNMILHEEIHHELDSIDTTLQKLNNIITDVADSSNIPKHNKSKIQNKKSNSKRKQKRNNKKWFDQDCKAGFINFKTIVSKIRKEPFNRQLFQDLQHKRKLYKKMIQSKKRQFTNNIINQLEMLQHKSPKEFWNAAKNPNLGHNNMQNTPKNIPVKEWLSHFKNLMGEPNNNETTNDFEKSISNYINENQLIFNQLNFRITDSEITRAILLLKNNKSP